MGGDGFVKTRRWILVCFLVICIGSLIGAVVAYCKYLLMYQQAHDNVAFHVGGTVLFPPVMPYDGIHSIAIALALVSAVTFVAVLVCAAMVMRLQWKVSLLLVGIVVLPLLWLAALNHTLAMHIHWFNMRLFMRAEHGIGDFATSWHVQYREWVTGVSLLFVITLASFVIWVRSRKPRFNRTSGVALIAFAIIFIVSSVGAWVTYRTYLIAFYQQYDAPAAGTAIGTPSFYGHAQGRMATIAFAIIWALSIIGMIAAAARAVRFRWRDTLYLLGSTLLPIPWLCALAEALRYADWMMMRAAQPGDYVVTYLHSLIGWSSVTILLFLAFLASFLLIVKKSAKEAVC